jgi:hypothetical protein
LQLDFRQSAPRISCFALLACIRLRPFGERRQQKIPTQPWSTKFMIVDKI